MIEPLESRIAPAILVVGDSIASLTLGGSLIGGAAAGSSGLVQVDGSLGSVKISGISAVARLEQWPRFWWDDRQPHVGRFARRRLGAAF